MRRDKVQADRDIKFGRRDDLSGVPASSAKRQPKDPAQFATTHWTGRLPLTAPYRLRRTVAVSSHQWRYPNVSRHEDKGFGGAVATGMWKLNSSGTYLNSYNFASYTAIGWSVGLDGNKNLYVFNSSDQVMVLQNDGTLLTQWPTAANPGSFSTSTTLQIVWVDKSNRVYVADGGNYRVQMFSTNGTSLAQWGGQGTGPGQFSSTLGVATDRTGGYVYVADPGNNRIQVFSYTAPATRPIITGASIPVAGQFFLQFTSAPTASYNVLSSTNITLPVTNWTLLGMATQATPGLFRFTDLSATNSQNFYILRSP